MAHKQRKKKPETEQMYILLYTKTLIQTEMLADDKNQPIWQR